MKLVILILATVAAFAQSDTKRTIIPKQDNSATGILEFKSLYGPGQNGVQISAPDSLGSTYQLRWPASAPTADGQCLAALASGQFYFAAGACEKTVSDYNWSKNLGTLAAGPSTLTITFSNNDCPFASDDPLGVIRVYELLIPGTYEIITSTGASGVGRCTRGGSGTIDFSHGGIAFTTAIATSASSGALEAILSVPDSYPVSLRAKDGTYGIYSNITPGNRHLTLHCDSPRANFQPLENNLKVFEITSLNAARIYDCSIDNSIHAHTGITAIHLDSPTTAVYGARFERLFIRQIENGIHGVTWYSSEASFNVFHNCSHACLWIENINAGDAGTGNIVDNTMACLSGTCQHAVLWSSPGGAIIARNKTNGFTEQISLYPTFGRVSTANSGADTTVTWVSGNRFRSSWNYALPIQIGSVYCNSPSWVSSTTITCAGQNLGTLTDLDYFQGSTTQIDVKDNMLDGGNTTHGVRWHGPINIRNIQINGNRASNYGYSGAVCVGVEGAGAAVVDVKLNQCASAPGTSSTALNLTGGTRLHVAGNTMSGYDTGINIASGVSGLAEGNNCDGNGTACIASASTAMKIREAGSVTAAQIAAMTIPLDGSQIHCSDCDETGAGGGTGAFASVIDGAWSYSVGAGSRWTPDGSDIYRLSKVGIGTLPIAGTMLSIKGDTADGTIDLRDSTGAGILLLSATATSANIGTFTNKELIIFTDLNARWSFTAAGMFTPYADDTFDIGIQAGPHVRGLYAGFGQFFKSGGSPSSDYVSSRKFNIYDTTGSNAWDVTAVASGVASSLTIRDSAGSRWLTGTRAVSSTPANEANIYANLIPAGRQIAQGDAVNDVVLPELGKTAQRFSKGFIQLMHATAFGEDVKPLTNTLLVGGPSDRWGNVYSILGNYSGLLTTVGLTINTSTPSVVGQVWTATNTAGAGSWQNNAAALWTYSAPNIHYSVGNVGIYTAVPLMPLHVTGTQGSPATSGTTPTGTARFVTVNSAMDIGSRSNGNTWMQVADATNLATEYALELNPNGGDLEMGNSSSTTTFTGFVDMLNSGINYMYGTLSPQTTGAGSIGASGARYGKFYGVDAHLSGRLQVTGNTTISPRGGIEFSYDSAGNGGAGWGGLEVYGPGGTTPKAMTWVAEDHRFYFGAVTTHGWTINSSGHFVPATNNARDVGASGTRVKKVWAVDVDFSGTCTGCSGGGTTFADNVFRVQDNGDATKQLAFQLAGFTTGNTRTLTPQNGSYTIAGLDITQTFTSPQTFSSTTVTMSSSTFTSDLIPTTGSVYALGGSSTRWIGYFNTLNTNGIFTFGNNILPSASTSYNIGSSSARVLDVHTSFVDLYNDLTFNSGATFTGSLIPSANNLYAIGNTSFRISTLNTVNINFSGGITTPGGFSALSVTKTVRDSAGTGTCTLIFDAGLLRGGTC